MIRKMICVAVLFGLLNPCAAMAQGVAVGEGQIGAPIEWLDAGLGGGLVHMGQRAKDGKLHLTVNESFFPKRGLRGVGKSNQPDVNNLNKGMMYESISSWDEGEPAQWGLWVERSGMIIVDLWMSGVSGGEQFKVELVGVGSQVIKLKPSAGDAGTLVGKVLLNAKDKGRQVLQINKVSEAGGSAKLHRLSLSGPAIKGGALIRKRWRPAAAHARFSSSQQAEGVKLWIMEMDAVPGELNFYSPVTTPFGYYGPSWLADGRVNVSFNFSLWSYKRGAPEPAIQELSHLLAIGNPTALFDGFGHEGTGVKVRGWDPLEGRQEQRQALALRVEPASGPNGIYDTYTSYFYAADEKRWRLFGVGNKFNKGKPLESLWVGSFVEVPGPPDRQRTGTTIRKMRYRGWVMNDAGKLVPLDRISVGDVDKATGLTYTDRGMGDDGWFYMETGGWVFRPAPKGDYVSGDLRKMQGRPEYLAADKVKALLGVPSGIKVVSVDRKGATAAVAVEIHNASKHVEAWVYWGADEGLTLADRWANKVKIDGAHEGMNRVVLKGVAGANLKLRVLLKNDEGQFWSVDTFVAGE